MERHIPRKITPASAIITGLGLTSRVFATLLPGHLARMLAVAELETGMISERTGNALTAVPAASALIRDPSSTSATAGITVNGGDEIQGHSSEPIEAPGRADPN